MFPIFEKKNVGGTIIGRGDYLNKHVVRSKRRVAIHCFLHLIYNTGEMQPVLNEMTPKT